MQAMEGDVGGWPDRVRLPLAVDTEALAADLARVEQDEWVAHAVRQNYAGGWSFFPLRCKEGARHPVMMIYADPMATRFEDTPYLARLPAMAALLARFQCPLRGARLMRLSPGSAIHEHYDHDLDAALGMARIHVPVRTNPKASFLLNKRPVTMAVGEVWYLRLSDDHSAANAGDEDRIHLVIDADMNPWLAALLDAGAAGA